MNGHPNNQRYNQNSNDINNHNFGNIKDKGAQWNNNINKDFINNFKKNEKADNILFYFIIMVIII